MINVGDYVKTNTKYKNKLYSPLYHEEILIGEVSDIDKNGVATVKIIESSCRLVQPYNYHMDKWQKGSYLRIHITWLKLL